MPRTIDVLNLVVEKIERDNPFGLILKGGTALALHHLNGHRESEDLDFDVPIQNKIEHKNVVLYLKNIFSGLVEENVIFDVKYPKEGFAKTDRYHMKVLIKMHPRDPGHLTKIDIDYIQVPEDIEKVGDLGFYRMEQMIISKLQTFYSRLQLKDFFDIFHLIKNTDVKDIGEPDMVIERIDSILRDHDEEELSQVFGDQYRHVDMRFQDLKEGQLKGFVDKAFREMRKFRNELSK